MNNAEIMTLADDALSAAEKKGNLSHILETLNPLNYFTAAHNICFRRQDKGIDTGGQRVKLHIIKTTRPFLPWLWVIVDFPLCLFQILYIAQKNRIVLIRGFAPSYASFFGMLVSKIMGIPLVLSVGGDHRLARDLSGRYPVFNYRPIDRMIEESVLRNADTVICPNDFSRRYVIRLGTPFEKTVIIPWPMKQDIFDFKYSESQILQDNRIDPGRPIILYVSRLEKDKQVEVLFEAVPLILSKFPDAQFVFIGDGSLLGYLKKRASELGIEKSVFFMGYQDQEVIKYCIKKASIVWIPMSGLVILEAAAAAKPIIAFDIEWHGEFIENNLNGLLVENRNYEKLAEAAITLLGDVELAERLGRAARLTLDKGYNPVKLYEKQIEVLLEAIEKRHKAKVSRA